MGITPTEFYWEFTPLELHHALTDFDDTHWTPMQRTCEMLREVGATVHNSAFGRKKKDMISDPQKWMRFSWERPKVQTVEQMKSFMLGLALRKDISVEVTQKKPKMKRTK